MKKIKEEFDVLENELNKMLYYNYEDVYGIKSGEEIDKLETDAFNKGKEQGIEQNTKETVLKMLENNLEDDMIMNILNIDCETLEKYKNGINH